MSFSMDQVLQFLSSPSFTLWQTIALTYLGLLWLSIIIWVIRDSIGRTNSLSFQIFAILLNIAMPVLGVILYLIIRPGATLTTSIPCPHCQERVKKTYQERLHRKKKAHP